MQRPDGYTAIRADSGSAADGGNPQSARDVKEGKLGKAGEGGKVSEDGGQVGKDTTGKGSKSGKGGKGGEEGKDQAGKKWEQRTLGTLWRNVGEEKPPLGLRWQKVQAPEPGMRWRKVGKEAPQTGRPLPQSDKLAHKLAIKSAEALKAAEGRKSAGAPNLDFTRSEWDALMIKDVQPSAHIKDENGDYYQTITPVLPENEATDKLAKMLTQNTLRFTKKEWEAFGIDDLQEGDHIKAATGDYYTSIRPLLTKPASGVEELRRKLSVGQGQGKNEFSKKDWDAFEIPNLQDDDHVLVAGEYFRPDTSGKDFWRSFKVKQIQTKVPGRDGQKRRIHAAVDQSGDEPSCGRDGARCGRA